MSDKTMTVAELDALSVVVAFQPRTLARNGVVYVDTVPGHLVTYMEAWATNDCARASIADRTATVLNAAPALLALARRWAEVESLLKEWREAIESFDVSNAMGGNAENRPAWLLARAETALLAALQKGG